MIEYTDVKLMAFGLLGIVLHNLVELNKINRANGGNVNILQYIKLEVFSILICLITVFVCILAKHEITQLEQVGEWLGLAFVSIGYMGQSILIWFMGKAEKKINEK